MPKKITKKKPVKTTKQQSTEDLFNPITKDDILKFKDGKFVIGDKILPDDITGSIISEVKSVVLMELWHHLLRDLKYQCNLYIYDKAKSMDDIWFGKGGLYVISILEQRLQELAKL